MAIDPDRRWERFAGWFGRYVRRLVRKRFASVRIMANDAERLAAFDLDDRPLMVIMNHGSWWDPLVGVLLADALVPTRTAYAPMDATQLRKIGIFRWLGVFGVDPDDPATMREMAEHVASRFRDDRAAGGRPTLWITPQGEFTDVRVPVRLRPGAAAVAARVERDVATPQVLAVGVEYAFWEDQLPEMCIAIDPVTPERPGLSGWHRAMEAQLQATLDRLATAVIARDPHGFTPLVAGTQGRTGFVYDLWLKMTGRSGRIEARRKDHTTAPAGAGSGTR